MTGLFKWLVELGLVEISGSQTLLRTAKDMKCGDRLRPDGAQDIQEDVCVYVCVLTFG